MESILGTIVAILGSLGISIVIEKSPIKINPLSMIKKFLVGDLSHKVDDMNKKFDKLDEKVDENEKDRLRETILTYKKSIDNGIPLSEHEYEYLLKIYDKYRNMGGNSFITEVVKSIKESYHNEELKNNWFFKIIWYNTNRDR